MLALYFKLCWKDNPIHLFKLDIHSRPGFLLSNFPNSFTGSRGGLELILNVEQYEYISTRENFAAGFKVSIHDQAVNGKLMEAHAVLVPPGERTTLAISQSRVRACLQIITALRKDCVILQLYWWLLSSTTHCS